MRWSEKDRCVDAAVEARINLHFRSNRISNRLDLLRVDRSSDICQSWKSKEERNWKTKAKLRSENDHDHDHDHDHGHDPGRAHDHGDGNAGGRNGRRRERERQKQRMKRRRKRKVRKKRMRLLVELSCHSSPPSLSSWKLHRCWQRRNPDQHD